MSNHDLTFKPKASGIRFIGLPADNQFLGNTSAARALMSSKQRPQTLELISPDISRLQSGLEKDLHHHTFKMAIPCDADIIDVIPIRPENPWRTMVFYRDVENNALGHIELKQYYSGDGKHGFLYQPTDTFHDKLWSGTFIPANEPILEAPSTLYEGEHNYGMELNTAICSMPETAEDGIVVSDSALKRLGFHLIHERSVHIKYGFEPVTIGQVNGVPLVIPEPGMELRDDGIFMALRSIGDGISPLLSHRHHLERIYHDIDAVHQIHGANSKVVDLWVMRSNQRSHLPSNPQLDRLADICQAYQTNVIAAYRRIRHNITKVLPATENMLTNMMLISENAKRSKEALGLNINKTPMPPFYIEITIAQKSLPGMAAKLSDKFSAKSVIVTVKKEEDMPIDGYGKRAEVVVSREAGTNRNIVGRDHAQFIVSCIETANDEMLRLAKLTKRPTTHTEAKRAIRSLQQSVQDEMLGMLHELYTLINKQQAIALEEFRHDYEEMQLLLADSLERGIVIGLPLDVVAAGNERTNDHSEALGPIPIIEGLLNSRFYRPPTPVTYTLFNGDKITTESPIMIAPVYYALLDKLGTDCSATYTTTRQVRGLTSLQSKHMRQLAPISNSSVKILGNDECIVLSSAVGPVALAKFIRDLSDPSYNMASIKRAIVTGEVYPDMPVDQCPIGESPSIKLIRHIFLASGIELNFKPSH